MREIKLPKEGFVFLDINQPYVAWAVYRGVLITPPNIRSNAWQSLSWWQTNLHRNSLLLRREAALEAVRQEQFPEQISRLNGIFCFLDRQSAMMASKLWGHPFIPDNLAEINLEESYGRDKLDSNWISYSDHEEALTSDDWIPRYWRGEPYPNEEPIWETLVEGKATVMESDLQPRAYEVVKMYWPDSLMWLEISRLGAKVSSNIGSISAFVEERQENYHFKFFMDMRDAEDQEFLDRLRHLIASGHHVNMADMEPHIARGSFGSVPDMRRFEFSCTKDMRLTIDDG